MPDLVYSIIFFIVAIGALITFHEYGHYWVARKMGVTVLRFSVGFGPALWKYVPKNSETEFVVAAIPLGGYVRMLDGNIDDLDDTNRAYAFDTKPLYKRSAIVAAGPLANFLLAALLYAAVFAIGTEGIRPIVGEVVPGSLAERAGFTLDDEIISIDGRNNESWDQHHFYILNQAFSKKTVEYTVLTDGLERTLLVDYSEIDKFDLDSQSLESMIGLFPRMPMIQAIVGEVVSGYPAQLAGIRAGDLIESVNGEIAHNWNDLVGLITESTNESLLIGLVRDGTREEVTLTPRIEEADGQQRKLIGIKVDPQQQLLSSDYTVTIRHNPVQAVVKGFESMWATTVFTVKMLVSLLKFEQSADSIGGPIAIADYAGKAAQAGVNNYLTFLALLSVSLGLLNLLPIPVLDGGQLVFHLYEAIVGSPPKETMLIRANQIGFFLLIGLMGLAFYNDISRLF